jgi:lauroyl/myristoyl acyltransferase
VAIPYGNLAVVARRMDFGPLQRWVTDLRSRYGTEILPKQRSMRKLLTSLKANKIRDVEENTARFTSIIVQHVREHLERYFWFHKRWKTKNCCPLP